MNFWTCHNYFDVLISIHSFIKTQGVFMLSVSILINVLWEIWKRYSFLVKRKFEKFIPLRWRHNGCDSVSNHQPRECLLRRLIRRTSKKTSKLRVTGLCVGNSPGPVNSPHKGPVTRKMFPFDDVIMLWLQLDAQLAAFDHVTTRDNKGSPHSRLTSWGDWPWPVANTVSTEVRGLGKTNWCGYLT